MSRWNYAYGCLQVKTYLSNVNLLPPPSDRAAHGGGLPGRPSAAAPIPPRRSHVQQRAPDQGAGQARDGSRPTGDPSGGDHTAPLLSRQRNGDCGAGQGRKGERERGEGEGEREREEGGREGGREKGRKIEVRDRIKRTEGWTSIEIGRG